MEAAVVEVYIPTAMAVLSQLDGINTFKRRTKSGTEAFF